MDTATPAEVDAKLQLIKMNMPETYKAVQAKAREMGTAAYALVRRGLRGEPGCFWACERGHVVGTPFAEDALIMADVARIMVTFGCSFAVIWPVEPSPIDGPVRVHASYQPGAHHGSH